MTDIFSAEIIQDTMIRPGPNGHTISGPDWSDVKARLLAVEGKADTSNPYEPPVGFYVGPMTHGVGGSLSTVAIVAGQALWTPIWTPVPMSIDLMGVFVTTAQPGAQLRLSVYNAAGARLRDAGTVNAETTGPKLATISAPQTLERGLTWLCVQANSVSGVEINRLVDTRPIFIEFATATPVGSFADAASFASAPASMSTAGAFPWAPHLIIRRSA
jgi:hypothetical protein